MKSGGLLHVGCGSDPLPQWAQSFKETRLDINYACNPHIVASMVDMGDIGTFDAVLCVHALEHLYPHEVNKALTEFLRVLNDDGKAIVFVPDLEDVKATEEVLFESPAGSITGLDLLYGYRKVLSENPHMAHKTGFVDHTLRQAFIDAGFSKVIVKRLDNHNMMGVGIK